MTCKCEHWQVCDECRPVRFPKTEGKDMTKELLQQALEALIESRDDVDLCYAGVKAARLSFRQERQLGFYEAQLVKHDAAIEALKQALGQQEQCGCREGECETKKDKTCRMTIEIAERDGIPEWTPAIGIECAISSLRDDAARLRDGSYMRIQIADDLDVIANDLAKCKSLTQQAQPPELSESDMLKIYTAATGRHIKVKEEGERRNVFRLMKAVETHCREGVSPLPRPTRWAALNAVTDEWNRRDRPSRTHQAAIIFAADLALDIADELEFIAEKIRQGNITEGAGGGSGFNWSWCVISDQGGPQ